MEAISQTLGIPMDALGPAIMLVSSYLLCIPYALMEKTLVALIGPNGQDQPQQVAADRHQSKASTLIIAKHLFSIIASASLFTMLFDVSGYIQLVALAVACYYLSLFTRHNKYGPLMVVLLSMGTLSANQLYAQIFSGKATARVDHTVPMMLLVQRATSYAWSLHDGTRPEKTLSPQQRNTRIQTPPSLISFLGYIFFFPTFLVGPAVDFTSYQDFIQGDNVYAHVPSGWKKTWAVLKTFLAAMACHASFVYLVQFFTYEMVVDHTDVFLSKRLWQRYWHLMASGLCQRMQFYTAWLLAEGSCILVGIGYSGPSTPTKPSQWDTCSNVDIGKIEMCENTRMFIGAWNIRTARWLRETIYLRLAPEHTVEVEEQVVDEDGKVVETRVVQRRPKGNPSLAAWLTYTGSAFWHGFYPGYYLSFLSLSAVTTAGRLARRSLRPLFLSTGPLHPLQQLYHILGTITTVSLINYVVGPFQLQSFQRSWAFWQAWGFAGHILMFGFIAVLEGWGMVEKKFLRRKSRGEEVKLVVGGQDDASVVGGKSADSLAFTSSTTRSRKRGGGDQEVLRKEQ